MVVRSSYNLVLALVVLDVVLCCTKSLEPQSDKSLKLGLAWVCDAFERLEHVVCIPWDIVSILVTELDPSLISVWVCDIVVSLRDLGV